MLPARAGLDRGERDSDYLSTYTQTDAPLLHVTSGSARRKLLKNHGSPVKIGHKLRPALTVCEVIDAASLSVRVSIHGRVPSRPSDEPASLWVWVGDGLAIFGQPEGGFGRLLGLLASVVPLIAVQVGAESVALFADRSASDWLVAMSAGFFWSLGNGLGGHGRHLRKA
jgi:hypothetical protein